MKILSNEDVARLLPMATAMDVVEQVMKNVSKGS